MTVEASRQRIILGLLIAVTIVTALLLSRVLATVFFAITVASVLVPLETALRRRGLGAWWSATIAIGTAFLAMVLIVAPLGLVLYTRRIRLVQLLQSLPERTTLEVLGFSYVIMTGDVIDLLTRYVTSFAVGLVRTAPVLVAKTIVFGLLVFALLSLRSAVRRGILGPIPATYHDVALALHGRVRRTLSALYVTQAATAVGTFLIALPVFWVLGLRFPVTLAVVAGILQFLPVVGPSILILALAAFEASAGAFDTAVTVLVVGLVLVGFAPDAIIRPRLARRTANLPASLYFVGFTGGVLSLGPIGIIAGPLVVALLVEALSLLADELNDSAAPRAA